MVRYAKSYIDQIYATKDLLALEGVIDVVSQTRQLPEQFSLFRRILAWIGWSGSGIWQYYEAITREDFETVASTLERFDLVEIASRYRSGMHSWKTSSNCDDLDHWLNVHSSELENTAFQLIARDRAHLFAE